MVRTLDSHPKAVPWVLGKVVLCSHGPSSIVWKWEWTMLWDHCIFVGRKKEGRIWLNIICLKLYQFERITWWCLDALESVLLNKYGLPWFSSSPPLGGEPDEYFEWPWNLIHSPPCRTPCRLPIHLYVWSELGQSPPFRPMRALRLQWSWAFSLVWKWPWLVEVV